MFEYNFSPLVVHVGKETHDELAVHTVSHTTVARNRVTKVLDVESTLQTRCEETAEGSDQRSESSEDHNVELNGGYSDGGRQMSPVGRDERKTVSASDEDRINLAFKTSKDVSSEVVDGADELILMS